MNIRKTGVLLLLLGLLFGVFGCGDDEAVHTNAEIQGMETDRTKENPTEEDSESSETVTGDGQAQDTVSGDDVMSGEDNGLAPEELTVEEPLKSRLTAELLEENELDTSVIDNTRATKGCTFTLPEGFEASEDVKGMYVTGRYPIDASTIYYVQLEQDMALQLMTQESFKEQTQDNFREIYGEDVEVSIDGFEQIKIQGYPAFRILCHYQVQGVKVTQLAYIVNADKSYVITYSQTSDYDRMEEYEASAATIQVE